jgi:hypothetical protein
LLSLLQIDSFDLYSLILYIAMPMMLITLSTRSLLSESEREGEKRWERAKEFQIRGCLQMCTAGDGESRGNAEND